MPLIWIVGLAILMHVTSRYGFVSDERQKNDIKVLIVGEMYAA